MFGNDAIVIQQLNNGWLLTVPFKYPAPPPISIPQIHAIGKAIVGIRDRDALLDELQGGNEPSYPPEAAPTLAKADNVFMFHESGHLVLFLDEFLKGQDTAAAFNHLHDTTGLDCYAR